MLQGTDAGLEYIIKNEQYEIGTTELEFFETAFSSAKIPGKIIKRDRNGNFEGAGSGNGSGGEEIPEPIIYGARWHKNQSPTALERIHDAVGKTFVPSNGSAPGSSSFDSIYPWSGIKRCVMVNGAVTAYEGEPEFSLTPSSGDVMVEIPAYYYKIIETANDRDYIISDIDPSVNPTPPEGFQLSPRHAPIPNKPAGQNKIYIGAYTCNSAYRSISGNASVTNISRATARTQCRARGTGYGITDYAAYWTVAMLYLVEVANWDSQRVIGQGVSSGSGKINTGDTDGVPWHSGSPVPTNTRRGVKYRGMENLWGNIWQFTDGFNFNNSTIYINLNPATYADDTAANYTALSYSRVAVAGIKYIKALGLDPLSPWAQAPTDVSGADGSYISDQNWPNTGWNVSNLGGSWIDGSGTGLFAFCSQYSSLDTSINVGARLLVLP